MMWSYTIFFLNILDVREESSSRIIATCRIWFLLLLLFLLIYMMPSIVAVECSEYVCSTSPLWDRKVHRLRLTVVGLFLWSLKEIYRKLTECRFLSSKIISRAFPSLNWQSSLCSFCHTHLLLTHSVRTISLIVFI